MAVHSESLLCTVVAMFDLKTSLCPRLNLNLDHPLGSNCVGFWWQCCKATERMCRKQRTGIPPVPGRAQEISVIFYAEEKMKFKDSKNSFPCSVLKMIKKGGYSL